MEDNFLLKFLLIYYLYLSVIAGNNHKNYF